MPDEGSSSGLFHHVHAGHDVCMRVVNKQFMLLEFVFESVYVAFQFDEIYLTFTAESVCLCGVCSPVVVVCL